MGHVDDRLMRAPGWAPNGSRGDVLVVLSEARMRESGIAAAAELDRSLMLLIAPADAPLKAAQHDGCVALAVEVDRSEASLTRLQRIRQDAPTLPVIAMTQAGDVATMRTLLQLGVSDVVSLPLQLAELNEAVLGVRRKIGNDDTHIGDLVTVIKSVGGVGATMIATQVASMRAATGVRTCLLDLDLQFGNVGMYLGASSSLTMTDLIQAGSRVDREFLQTVALTTSTGLRVVTAPADITPIESVDADQVLRIIDGVQREFDSVFVDLPGTWTNWSLSLALRSAMVILVVDLTVASLRQARRQLDLLRGQGADPDKIHVIVNRVERRLFRGIGLKEAATALDHPIALQIRDDPSVVVAALDQGMLLDTLAGKSRVVRDLGKVAALCADMTGRAR